jgi:uncharacterized SAM-binding protein YcdF (DUF218 family)
VALGHPEAPFAAPKKTVIAFIGKVFAVVMFLFLSKLLPLLVYPLGLSCLLLGASLILWRWRPRWAQGVVATTLVLLILASNSNLAALVVKSLEWRYLPLETIPKAEAIVVLGGSTHAATTPRPWVEVSEAGDRVLYGVKLYKDGKAPLLVFSGGRIDWKEGGPPEADDMTQIALVMGVPANAILQEGTSLNTYENAVNVKALLRAQDIRTVLLVTSAMHMPRAMAIFQKQGINAIATPTDYWVSQGNFQENRSFQGSLLNLLPDTEALHFFTRALKEYIGLGIYRLKGWL